jgi:uncharacterized protein (TIGR00251 family)
MSRIVPLATTIMVKVVPRASSDEIVGWCDGTLRLRVMAPPQDNRANAALSALLAEALGVPKRAVAIVSGHGSAHKRVAIAGLDRAQIEQRLGAAQRGRTGHESNAAI